MVGKFEVWKLVESGKLSRESDGLESCSREKDVAPASEVGWLVGWCVLTRIFTHLSSMASVQFSKH